MPESWPQSLQCRLAANWVQIWVDMYESMYVIELYLSLSFLNIEKYAMGRTQMDISS